MSWIPIGTVLKDGTSVWIGGPGWARRAHRDPADTKWIFGGDLSYCGWVPPDDQKPTVWRRIVDGDPLI